MPELLACACGIDPATESMVAQAGIALALSAPYWFRDQIRDVVRRLRGRPAADCEGSVHELERHDIARKTPQP
jgi:hypothetical protein